MLLTTYERVKRHLQVEKANDISIRGKIGAWIDSVSVKIETYLNRAIELQARTEYFDGVIGVSNYWPSAYPIQSITSLEYDEDSLFVGNETTIDDYYTHIEDRALFIDEYVPLGRKKVKLVYTGGLALTAASMVCTVADATEAAVGRYVSDDTTGAYGLIRAVNGTSVTIEVFTGVFSPGNTISFYLTELDNLKGSTTISSITTQPLCMTAPPIVAACEHEIRYMFDKQYNIEQSSSNREGTTTDVKSTMYNYKYGLLPSTRSMLQSYKRLSVAAC